MTELTFDERNRLIQLQNILDEIRYLRQEQSVLDTIESETIKGINHIKNNAGKNDFFFPEQNYMNEKIGLLKDSAKYIENLMFSGNE